MTLLWTIDDDLMIRKKRCLTHCFLWQWWCLFLWYWRQRRCCSGRSWSVHVGSGWIGVRLGWPARPALTEIFHGFRAEVLVLVLVSHGLLICLESVDDSIGILGLFLFAGIIITKLVKTLIPPHWLKSLFNNKTPTNFNGKKAKVNKLWLQDVLLGKDKN